MPPTPKLPAHLPKTWKYGNRNLKPGLSPGPREEYKSRIITPKVEPLWSRGVKFANFVACAAAANYIIFFADFGTHGHVFSELREKADSLWAQYWYISSKDRKRLEEARERQDAKIREQERLLDERIAARKARHERELRME